MLVLLYYVQMKSLLSDQNKSMMVACLISSSAPGNVSSLRTEERRSLPTAVTGDLCLRLEALPRPLPGPSVLPWVPSRRVSAEACCSWEKQRGDQTPENRDTERNSGLYHVGPASQGISVGLWESCASRNPPCWHQGLSREALSLV